MNVILNTSRYPDSEVVPLVQFALDRFGIDRVGVLVKNCKRGHSGTAYYRKTYLARSPFATDSRVDHMIAIRIGPPSSWPFTNIHTHRIRRPVSDWMHETNLRLHPRYTDPNVHIEVQRMGWKHDDLYRLVEDRLYRAPYGGKKSPEMRYADWRESLVAVTAHELHHVVQFRDGAKPREHECEIHAAICLDAYRAQFNRRAATPSTH